MSTKIERYPKIALRSKNEIAKRISGKLFPYQDALKLINDVLKNKDKYWADVINRSEPENGKYVRSAKATPFGRLLALIDEKILGKFDDLVPDFIFGGLHGRNHVQAAKFLLGQHKKRIKLSLDICKFFEQNTRARVFYFFYKKAKCGAKASNILADLCCVPAGPKGITGVNSTLARGFATSTRLALWCNLDLFLKIFHIAKKILKNKNCKIAIFVDDIGITASHIDKKEMELLYTELIKVFTDVGMPLNNTKTSITSPKDKNHEHLGLRLDKKLSPTRKNRSKYDKIQRKIEDPLISSEERAQLISKAKSIRKYRKFVSSVIMKPN